MFKYLVVGVLALSTIMDWLSFAFQYYYWDKINMLWKERHPKEEFPKVTFVRTLNWTFIRLILGILILAA